MSSSEYRQRVADHPRSLPGTVGGIAVTIGVVIALRIGAGLLLDDPVQPATYVAVVGGGLGAVSMFLFHAQVEEEVRFAPIDFWARRIGDGGVTEYQRQGLYLHVTYGAVLAGFYSRLMMELTGSGTLFATLPLSLVTGTIFGVALFVLGMVYARVGLFNLEFDPPAVCRFLASHLVFGIVLGAVLGLTMLSVVPLLGL